jgi:hypothetical protein
MLVWEEKTALLQAVRKGEDNENNHPLLPSPQRIPQYVEVPPNIEARRIILYFSDVLSYSSNPALLKDDPKLLFFFRLLASHLQLLFV